MRRPRFKRWIRNEVLRIAGAESFNLRKFAAQAQRDGNRELSCALLMHAHENGQFERLMSFVYDGDVADEFIAIEKHLGQRSIERLALRGIPMRSLPAEYRELLVRFEDAYHTPENIAEEKRQIWEHTKQSVLETGISPAEIAHELGLDQPNVSAYLSNGDVGRFTIATAREIAEFVDEAK